MFVTHWPQSLTPLPLWFFITRIMWEKIQFRINRTNLLLGVYACPDDERVTSVDRLAWPPISKGPTSQRSLSSQLVGTLSTIFTPFSTLLIRPIPSQPPSIPSDWLLLYVQSKSVKWELLYLPPIKLTCLHLCLASRFLSDYNRGEWF